MSRLLTYQRWKQKLRAMLRVSNTVALCAIAVQTTFILVSDAKAQEVSEPIEEIFIIGSRIERRDETAVSPVETIDQVAIEFSGQATIEELLNKLPQVAPGFGRSSNNPGDGTAQINLRGMGPERTLVMLNGRRVAASGVSAAVDLNNIPQSMIEKVEIVTGGASAVYGSDAMAGAVNFVTRKDLEGHSIDVHASMAEKGDAENYNLGWSYGSSVANTDAHATLFFDYHERKPLFASAREFTRVRWFDDWNGNLLIRGAGLTPAGNIFSPRIDFGNGPARTVFDPDGTPREFLDPEDTYNTQPTNYLQLPMKRYSAGAFFEVPMFDSSEFYSELLYSDTEVVLTLAPAPMFFFATVNTDNPLLTPETMSLFNTYLLTAPGVAQFSFAKRFSEAGLRVKNFDRDYMRVVAGLRGDLAGAWEYDASLTLTRATETEERQNGISLSRLLHGLLVDPVTGQCMDPSGGCVPVDIFGEGRASDAALEYIIVPTLTSNTERTQVLGSAFVRGPLVDLPAGTAEAAFGLEWRSDDSLFNADPQLASGDIQGYMFSSSVDGKETVFEVYAEAVVPLLNNIPIAEFLSLELGARYSSYDNAGDVWTYKLGGEWDLTETIRLRAMYQHSVRAPNNQELFSAQGTSIQSPFFFVTDDPCSAVSDPVGNGQSEKCLIQGLSSSDLGVFNATIGYPVSFTTGGNPDLKPESADTFTAGVVVRPEHLPWLRVSVDYFDIDIENTIGDIDALAICFDQKNVSNVFCSNIKRDGTGNISSIEQLTSNRGILQTSGIDIAANVYFDLPAGLGLKGGQPDFSAEIIWTHLFENASQENPVSTVIDCDGHFGWPCNFATALGTLPKNRMTANAQYQSGPLTARLTWRWIDDAANAAQIGADIMGWGTFDFAIDEIDAKNYLDLGLGWEFENGSMLRAGVNNLTDTAPPMMANHVGAHNTDTLNYDVFGRSFFVALSTKF